jgi:hypothetical protein
MTKSDQEKAIASFITIALLVIIIVIIKLWLAWIQFNRFLFWFDIIFIPLSFIAMVVSAIAYFKDEWNQEDWLIIGGVALGVFLFTVLTISGAYQKGYSDEAIQTKAGLEKMLEDYTFILSIYTGEFRLKVQGMVMDEFTKALCEAAPEVPCDQVISSYNAYQKLIGWKESADDIARIWR